MSKIDWTNVGLEALKALLLILSFSLFMYAIWYPNWPNERELKILFTIATAYILWSKS